MPNEIWKECISRKSLEAGWHLTRAELRSDFFFDVYYQQAFAQNLSAQIAELIRSLREGSFYPRASHPVLAPKGPLATRPGSHISLRDRVVLWSIVRNIAKQFESRLPNSVYSYRLKPDARNGELFRESDALSLPFLKRRQISAELDPFDAWYEAWPDFESRSKDAIGEGYRYLVVSDIAAYFENINLDLLKDQLMSVLDNEPVLCNFIYECLLYWATKSHMGSRPRRGIPQGSGIFSFLGNIYLLPIDEAFKEAAADTSIAYFRYTDDIRIFCRKRVDAQRAAFLLESKVREIHLNLQSAKTKILEERPSNQQITNSLFDDRIESLSALRDGINKLQVTESRATTILYRIARKNPSNPESKRLFRVTDPKSNLTDRAMRAWMNLCIRVGDGDHITTLLRQIWTNPDNRLSRVFINTCKTFPRKASLGNEIVSFVNSEQNIHKQQEAELIRGARYLSVIPDDLWRRALRVARDPAEVFQLKVQSLLLLGMRSHSRAIYNQLFTSLRADRDIIVHPYYVAVLGQVTG